MDVSELDFEQDIELNFGDDMENEEMMDTEFDCIEESWYSERAASQDSQETLERAGTSGSSYVPSQSSLPLHEKVEIEYKRKAVALWRSGKKKKISLNYVQSMYRHLKKDNDIYRWAQQVDDNGARVDKLKQINQITLEMFASARRERLIVHDDDVRRFAVISNKRVKLEGFKASAAWLASFKKLNRIVSR